MRVNPLTGAIILEARDNRMLDEASAILRHLAKHTDDKNMNIQAEGLLLIKQKFAKPKPDQPPAPEPPATGKGKPTT